MSVQIGSALTEILSGLRVVDEHGNPVPVQEISQRIWIDGVLVPAKSHRDKAFSMLGYWIATCLAYRQLGLPPVTGAFLTDDWKRQQAGVDDAS